MAALVELHTSSKKDNRNVWLVPVGTDVTTMNFFFALICRCLKLQKSLFLQLWITKVGIMMGPAVDTTARFSSYILNIWCCNLQFANCFFHHQFGVAAVALCLFRERLQLIGLKSFHQYDDGRKIFQRQFTAHFSIYKVGINQFVIYSAKLMYVICGSPLEVKAKG